MNPSTNIIIETGNPFETNASPASYSRFILPFAYCKIPGLTDWKEDILDKKDPRKNYFTKETSEVLFTSAKWYLLENWEFDLEYSEKKISVSPPKIVLFEAKSNSNGSLLKTGFLILELYFAKRQDFSLELLLEINELFRYKAEPYLGHKNPLADTFNCELAKYLPKKEDCEAIEYSHWQRLLNSFLGETPTEKWDIYADNRAFVWTCAVTKKGAKDLENRFRFQLDFAEGKCKAQNFGHWIKLLNVDKPRGDYEREHGIEFDSKRIHLSTAFERAWADKNTYKRWEESGGFYGFSYHSGAALISNMTDPDLWKHFGQMYFDMVLLLLYTRVTVFRFSNQLTTISIDATTSENRDADIQKWQTSFESLRWEFTLFTNLYQFPLISNQQQMLEMYAIAREALDIQELYNEVKEEIHNNQEFIEQRIAKGQAESSLDLTRIATLGLALGIAFAFIPTTLCDNLVEFLIGENGILRGTWMYRENGWNIRWGILIAVSFISFYGLRLLSCFWAKGLKESWKCVKEIFWRKK